jgi:hypothetical protein
MEQKRPHFVACCAWFCQKQSLKPIRNCWILSCQDVTVICEILSFFPLQYTVSFSAYSSAIVALWQSISVTIQIEYWGNGIFLLAVQFLLLRACHSFLFACTYANRKQALYVWMCSFILCLILLGVTEHVNMVQRGKVFTGDWMTLRVLPMPAGVSPLWRLVLEILAFVQNLAASP